MTGFEQTTNREVRGRKRLFWTLSGDACAGPLGQRRDHPATRVEGPVECVGAGCKLIDARLAGYAPIAQLVELRTFNPQVPGSSPGGGTPIPRPSSRWPARCGATSPLPHRPSAGPCLADAPTPRWAAPRWLPTRVAPAAAPSPARQTPRRADVRSRARRFDTHEGVAPGTSRSGHRRASHRHPTSTAQQAIPREDAPPRRDITGG